jgi:two-component system, OmpR family, phosphate regulon sensor histidine kinase PhoR
VKRVRLRTLFLLVALASVLPAGILGYLAATQSVRSGLIDVLEPRWSAELARNVGISVVAAAALALAIALFLASEAARWTSAALLDVRRRLAAGESRRGAVITDLLPLERTYRSVLDVERRAARIDAAAHRELRGLLDAVGEGILQVDRDQRIVRFNQAARRILRLGDSAIGERASLIVRKRLLRRRLHEAFNDGNTQPFEIQIDGRRYAVAVHAVEPALDASVGTTAWAVVFVDLTELRRQEDVRRDFVANASHELKTPLTSIRGYSETLLRDDLPPDTQRAFLETIHDNAQRLQRIVDDLLDLSRIESGAWHPRAEEVALPEVARGAWTSCASAASAKNLRFGIEGDEIAIGDEVAIGQVFTNLFENAIRYTPMDGSITVRMRREEEFGTHVLVSVTDTGTGVPSDALPRVFERFYRADPSRTREAGGTGLGLAIVKHLVESMGGSVHAASELGAGTTISFELPTSE